MSIAVLAQGTLFQINGDVSPLVYTTIPSCIKIKAPNVKFDLHDVTSHDSAGGFKEWLPGLSDGENATAELNYVPTNAIHIQLRTDAYARTLKTWNIVFPVPTAASPGTGSTINFQGYVVNYDPTADAGQPLRAALTVKVTGQPIWT